jgi:excisionase family DNA binding protein|tara:strand:- start:140 stop:442 length:303 start_codon:yes stop_codon:yes gene_type:complete
MSNQLIVSQEVLNILDEIKFLMKMNKKTLTLKEVAMYTGLSVNYMYKLTSKKKIPFYSPNGKTLYFDKAEIDSWLKTNRSDTEEEKREQAFLWAKDNRKK